MAVNQEREAAADATNQPPGASRAPSDDLAALEAQVMTALFSEAGRNDPHAVLASAALPGCRYEVVKAILHDGRFGAPRIGPSADVTFQTLARWMVRADGERHARVRSRFARVFTPRRAEQYRARIARNANRLIDAVADRGSMDLVAEFAQPLPFSIIVEVLGVPEERHDWLAAAMEVMGRGFANQRQRPYVEQANVAVAEMLEYFSSLVAERAAHPVDDLVSLLASAEMDDDEREDVVANCVFFVSAGHETTTTLLSAGTMLLCRYRDQLDALRAAPDRWPDAVEEMLRYISPITLTGTRVLADADIGGFHFAAGDHRIVAFAGANRDPQVFADPDRFDTTRSPNPHVAFSAGAHHCLGAPLARLHGQVGLATLFDRLPDLTVNGKPIWRGATPLRTIDSLPVTWSPGAATRGA